MSICGGPCHLSSFLDAPLRAAHLLTDGNSLYHYIINIIVIKIVTLQTECTFKLMA